ncbi:SMP-30/gluconolactonase/LRE family protein [Nocardia camponoti]|uniref:Strictosidine synthase n=1 Tax=Nocardia camponoti TaxID=1616106 RepID=A0A917V3W9_9NOCA|nr:SMP-30/gluconolactonase/LRE family protein [Nocardia camponoti]GGK32923.1 strictosidine synthase [Nocardia camponoti]
MIAGISMEPTRWTPPAAPARARDARGTPPLATPRRIELSSAGPEDVVVGDDGFVYAGLADGRIVRVDRESGSVVDVVNTGGRPLGLCAEPGGALLICDAHRGLLRWSGEQLTTLVDTVDGVPLNMASNVVVDDDGTIYFTTSSRRWVLDEWMNDLLEHSGTGRLLRRSPSGEVETLCDGLHFANGVAFTADQSALIVAETGGYRLHRYWLRGTRAGTFEPLVDNLPGFADNISLGSDGLIWVTLASPRNPLLDLLLPRAPFLRKLVWRLPAVLKPKPVRTVWVLGVDPTDGRVVHDLQCDATNYGMVTGVVEVDGTLILGSLDESAIAVTTVSGEQN